MTFIHTPLVIIAFFFATSWGDTVWAAQTETPPDHLTSEKISYADLGDEALIEVFLDYTTNNSVNVCEVKSLLSEMVKREALATRSGPIYIIASAECSIEGKNWKEAYSHMQEWEMLKDVDAPDAEWVFRLAYLAGARADALDRLEKIAQFENKSQLLKLTDRIIFQIVRDLRKDNAMTEITTLYSTLAQSPHFGKLQPNIRSAAASHILGERLKHGNKEEADAMLAHINSPFTYTELLAAHKYQPVWMEIEKRVGSNMKIVLEENLRIQAATYQESPDDKQIKQRYGHALLFAGKFEDVISLAQSIDHSAEGTLDWEEDDGWLLNLEAHAHDALGDFVKADRIFDSFTMLDNPANQNGWLVNFLINRASRLVDQTRWKEGLVAAKIAERIANETGNDYARMLVRKAKSCALHNLGQIEETQATLKEVETHHEDSLLVAVETFLCVGDRKRAAEITVKGLENEKERRTLIEALQNPLFDPFYSNSQLPTVHDELRTHPDVTKAFDRVARSIPDQFVPLGSHRRQKLAAERLLQ